MVIHNPSNNSDKKSKKINRRLKWENDVDDQSIPFADVQKTLVSFLLEVVDDRHTRLIVTESGISQLRNPAKVWGENSSGWDSELAELKTYVEAA